MESLEATAPVLVAATFVIGTIALALLTYFLARAVALRFASDTTKELAGSIAFRIAALHALILGLVFAQETQNYREISGDLVREATAVTDIFYDLGRFDGPDAGMAQQTVAEYAAAVVEKDWPLLSTEERLATESYVLWEATYQYVLDLPAQTPRETALRDHMLHDVHLIATLRQARQNAAQSDLPWLFWLAAAGGVVFVTIPYLVFPPTPLNLALLAIFGAYTGVVLAIIYAFADPFAPPGVFAPSAYFDVLRGEMGGARLPGG